MKLVHMMNGLLLITLLAGLPTLAAGQLSEADPSWGNAPDFVMTTYAGEEVLLSDFAGKPLILNFWAEWCPPCVAELPMLEEAWQDYGEDVQFMTVSLEKGRMDPAAFMEQRDLHLPGALAADEVAAQYGISGIPATFFISSEGNVLGMKRGAFVDEELPYVLDALLDYENQLLVTE